MNVWFGRSVSILCLYVENAAFFGVVQKMKLMEGRD